MHQYIYDGPVREFNNLVAERWRGVTIAPSESKARSNLTYQFKKSHNKTQNTRITLTGDIIQIN